jgi:hypothetical protein
MTGKFEEELSRKEKTWPSYGVEYFQLHTWLASKILYSKWCYGSSFSGVAREFEMVPW